MRMPRFAFGLMLILIFALSGSLALGKARPHGGSVLLLTIKLPPKGLISHCTFNTNQTTGRQQCSHGTDMGILGYAWIATRYIKRDGDRVHLAIKTKYSSESAGERGSDALADVPEQEYWLEPDRVLEVQVAGLGTMEVSGQFLDYIAALPNRPNEPLDPGPDEFRLWRPVLLLDNRVLVNVSGSAATDTGDDAATALYAPGLGRFVFSSVAFEGAIEGKIQASQTTFTLEGKSYLLLAGAPISRSERVWVLHQPDWRPSASAINPSGDYPELASGSLKVLLESKQ